MKFVHNKYIISGFSHKFVHNLYNNRGELVKDEYEYENTTELSGDAAFYFMIPSVLLNRVLYKNDENAYLLPVFSYFSIKRGLDNTITFNINQIVNWMNRIPNII